ncbi:MAG: hypothetical protein MRZ84_04310 [Eubacterium sp.]|nr:hypothetical protein [Eubacterium sp.]
MACFMVPATEAVITTVATKIMEKNEKKVELDDAKERKPISSPGTTFVSKMKWLNQMLWGGSALLAFEHLWHGEISPVFPFLTAMNSESGMAQMLHEMATTGVGMTVLVTFIWGIMVAVSRSWEKQPLDKKVLKSRKVRTRMRNGYPVSVT